MIPESMIGKQIKSLRTARNLTLEALAALTGYTKGYLSKVENSDRSPPVSTLIVIAKALGVTVSQIFEEEAPGGRCSLMRRDERRLMVRHGAAFGYAYEPLAHNYPDKKMEPAILTIPVQGTEKTVFQHEGEEMLLVLEGTLQFCHGETEYVLEAGDCVYFDSGIPHSVRCLSPRDVKCVMVIYVP
ncbi:MAG TPA: XRE family transcriptional regulator [Desulfobacteraceae bacterium]|nr:helix-turn-helix transcriptional regulator [Deltaproteobacteria bacterium]RLB95286.1 MAG: Cro/Cl family transcriptional regulator [Deltaproteobacteria bacterium]HDI60427.1 XRE family transcriptional regulator [Desulfobacteraceae bacterium]